MRAQIEILSEVFAEWLQVHELDYDYWIYSQDEWRQREENVLEGAELISAFENQLVNILNSAGAGEIEEELQDLAGGFGYYFELGHHWNIGFYPIDDWPPLPKKDLPYRELLKDNRWLTKRRRILDRSKEKCEDCGTRSDRIEVHHCYHRYGRYPWQYPGAVLLALCRRCHESRAKVELKWRGFMPKLRINELRLLQESLGNCLYWYDRDRLFTFLRILSRHDDDQLKKLGLLLKTWRHPGERGTPA